MKSGKGIRLKYKLKKFAMLKGLNYPSNCLTVDIENITNQYNLTGVDQIQLNFLHSNASVEIILEDKMYSVSRTLKSNKFGNTGQRIMLSDLTRKTFK